MPTLHNLFPKTETKCTRLNSLYEDIITFKAKSDKDTARKKITPIPLTNTDAKILNKILANQGASLVVQVIRIHLPIQGTQVQSLVQEDSISHGATKPMCHDY